MNVYAYVRGDPVNGSDPSGLVNDTEISPLDVFGPEKEPRGTSQSAATFAGQFDNLFGQMTEAQASAALDAQEVARLTNCPRGATTQFFTDKKGDQIGLPAMKTGTSLVFRGFGAAVGPLAGMIGRYEYTSENGQRVVGDFNTSAWAIGLGIGAEFDFYGQSRSLETFFGKGVDASGELFFVSISASLDSDTQESVGAGLGFVVMPIRFTDTKLDGAPKVSGSPCSETG